MAVLIIVTITVLSLQFTTGDAVLDPTLRILQGSDDLVALGTNVTLTCQVSGEVVHHGIVVKWLFMNAVQIMCRFTSLKAPWSFTTEKPDNNDKDCSLTISPVEMSSEGVYYCQLFDGRKLLSTSLELHIGLSESDNDSNNNCDVNAQCVNTFGGFKCTCNDGFTGDGSIGNCHDSTSKSTHNSAIPAVVISVICSVLVFAVVALVTFASRSRRNRRTTQLQETLPLPNAQAAECTVAMIGAAYEKRITKQVAPRESAFIDAGLPAWASKWEIHWSDLLLDDEILGRGNFGEVRSGAVRIGGKVNRSAIKMLRDNTPSCEKDDFMQEFRTMTLIGYHPNIVSLLGACKHQDVLYVALEYLPHGDLRSYLRLERSQSDTDENALTSDQLVKFALDVAKGMEHLTMESVIHRDLAARNILIGEGLVAKVSDFGLSRGEDVYVQMSTKRIPLRWLAIESVRHQMYTTQSDVWSFGIVLWEIATLGGTPYANIGSEALASELNRGYRMPKPNNCDDKIYALMRECWDENPRNRPTFSDLVSIMHGMAHGEDKHTYLPIERAHYMNLSAIQPEFDDN